MTSSSSDHGSASVPFQTQSSLGAPTPVNTPLNPAPIASRLSRPTIADIDENDAEDDDRNPSQAAINALMQHKLTSLIGRSSGYIESLPVPVKRRVEGLKGVATDYDAKLKEYKKEMYELEKKFLAHIQPLYQRRLDIISGVAEPTEGEVEAGEAVTAKGDPDATPLPKDSADPNAESPKGIPEFWLTALRNHIAFSNLITDRDEAALRHLTNIVLEYLEGERQGYKIVFHFSPNEFFEDATLTKEYRYKDELDIEGDYLYERAVGSAIHWKEDKDLTQEIEVKRQRNKATNRTRVVRRAKPTESFFNFFSPPEPPTEEAEAGMDDEELEEIEENLEMDYQLGQDLKDRVIPRAVDYFTGKALEWEEDDDDYEEDDDFDDDDDDDDDDDEDEEDEDIPAPRRRAAKDGKDTVDPEECKQQ
ncbi:uncharacterized protein EI90DRAFT_3063194 [Cantharellus anzutake]|uniref:uncharacterized protein n=1 Tax=Cantharellus anzutake TaxID=1750568 RepID=UPI0019061574|nr:uncharacterized protein EI90DRAFT_3063194 [Cantharellus anzutake]KAF8329104.1 hypothetical protein EI90DRAFT_3063194 [Cantharellus anzutake]